MKEEEHWQCKFRFSGSPAPQATFNSCSQHVHFTDGRGWSLCFSSITSTQVLVLGIDSWAAEAMIPLLSCSPGTELWEACREETFPLPHHLNCINCNFSKSSKELIKFWFANYFSIWLELAANHLWKRKVNLSLTFANRDFSVKKLILCIISL